MKISKQWEKGPGDIIILHKCTKSYDQMLYGSWVMAHVVCNCYFSFWTIFSTFTPLTAQKIKSSEKWKKSQDMSSFNTSVPIIMIKHYIGPEIWHMADVIVIFHFGLFLPFYSSNSPQKTKPQKNKKKKKKKSLDISLFYTNVQKLIIICFTVPEIWCVADVIAIFHFGLFFALLPPEKWKFQNNEKTLGDIIILHKCTTNHDMLYFSWDIWCMTDLIAIFHFGLFLPFYRPNSPKNENFKNKKKVPGGIIILYKCTKNHDHMLYYCLDVVQVRKRVEKMNYRGGCST